MSKQTWFEKIIDLDQRWIVLFTLIILTAPLLYPLGLPIKIGDNARQFFNMIENLPTGSVVVYIWGADSMTWMEQGLPATTVFRHLMSKEGIKIFVFSEMEQAPIYWEKVINDVGIFNKKYGDDFVYLGYIAGGESMFAAMAQDVWNTCGGKDYYGNDLSSLPMMANIHSATDVNVIVHLSMGWTFEYGLRQWQMPFNIPYYLIPLGALQASILPYRQTGQVSGWIAGAREAAEYESLLKSPGLALAQMDAQSIGHYYAIILIVLCNIGYFVTKRQGGKIEP